ncbi:YkvA family protein [Peribacillus glennii]|uniref:DUF1232 domain-containing protein n=1 Tax=Peribacillus glennii TaxID=2303991 RepID=A0A372L818_9BACI|nr:YkvA family protein [Peribacillus glennii]RFU60455.1 DUF1232 domain-containing protein [Peribacillus glennii]
MISKIKAWARNLKKQLYILYFAYKDGRVPWYTKLFTACVVAYAFSPVDLIPDFIPVLGYVDDIIIVPLGIMIALRLIPENVIRDCSEKASELMKNGKPKNWIAGSIIILIWFLILVGTVFALRTFIK